MRWRIMYNDIILKEVIRNKWVDNIDQLLEDGDFRKFKEQLGFYVSKWEIHIELAGIIPELIYDEDIYYDLFIE